MSNSNDTHRGEVPVFAWITGERTNLGDSLLRRPYVRALQAIGPLQIWINRSTSDFLSGLMLPHDATLTSGFATWYWRLIRSALKTRTVVVLNAGEFKVHPSRVGLLIALLFAAQIVRIRGGASIWIGVSIPKSDRRLLRLPVRFAGSSIDYVQWREAGSNDVAAPRAVGPDWAFAEGSPTEEWDRSDRSYCAFVLRGDRPEPTSEWFEWARLQCEALGLQPVVVVQVRQDQERAEQAARVLGGRVIDWRHEDSHLVQEERIRATYARSQVVIGDRLHGLVIGATEGAVPLGWVESSRGKVRTHFNVIGFAFASEFEGMPAHLLPVIDATTTLSYAELLKDAIERARYDLAQLERSIATIGDASPYEMSPLRRR